MKSRAIHEIKHKFDLKTDFIRLRNITCVTIEIYVDKEPSRQMFTFSIILFYIRSNNTFCDPANHEHMQIK